MERELNFAGITSVELLTDERFIQWLVYPDKKLTAYWMDVQCRYPHIVPLIARIRCRAAREVLPDRRDREILLPCG